MTRGYRPVGAIAEAERQAIVWGFIMLGIITETKLPFDFIIYDRGCTSLVRI